MNTQPHIFAPSYAEQIMGQIVAQEASRELDRHTRGCWFCNNAEFGYCPEAMRLIANRPEQKPSLN